MQSKTPQLLKIVMVGKTNVGKSKLIDRFINDKYSDTNEPTIGVDFFAKILQQANGSSYKLQIWDTSGQEKYLAVTKSYYRGAHGLMLVYDITNPQTFQYIKIRIEQLKKTFEDCGFPAAILIGNKSDAAENRKISYQEGEYLGKTVGGFIQVSALTGSNIQEAFQQLLQIKNKLKMTINQLNNIVAAPTAAQLVFDKSKKEISVVQSAQPLQMKPGHGNPIRTVKIILTGPQKTGKSMILLSYCERTFCESYIPTIGVDFRVKNLEYQNNMYRVQIWDTAGQQRFRAIVSSYQTGSEANIYVYDSCNIASFDYACKMLLQNKANNYKTSVIAIVGNKLDRHEEIEVKSQMVEKFAKDFGVHWFEVSAKKGTSIDYMFQQILLNVLNAPQS